MAGAIAARLIKLADPAIKRVLPRALNFLGKGKVRTVAGRIDKRLLKVGLRKYNIFGLKGNNQFFNQGPATKGLEAFRGALQRQHAKYPLARAQYEP